jgi:ribonucleotide monophosphatase NagD (HAD superfamily)
VNSNEWLGTSLTTTSGAKYFALSVLDRYDTVLFDLDGTLYVDGDPLPGAQQFLEACISVPGVFSAVQVLERVLVAPNAEVVNCGKPSDSFATTIQNQLGPLERVLVVGDSLESDIALANNNGWSSLLLGSRPTSAGQIRADYWAPSLAAIMAPE